MLKIVSDTRLDRRTVLELPLAAMAEYPGAVVVTDGHGASWPAGGRLALTEMLRANGHWHEVEAAAARAIASGYATVIVLADGGDDPIEATLLPLHQGQALALLRPLDFEKALRRSLIESRQRYKELVEIASDFTWETDAEGRFSFISPRGALDWTASELVGRPVAEFLAGGGAAEIPPVFRARAACDDGDVWFRRADGASDCLAVAAVPRVDGTGAWLGARGLGRRVTEQWQRDRDAAHGHLRDRLVTHLARTIGDEIDPLHALAAAASATGLALSASGAVIYRRGDGNDPVAVAQWGIEPSAEVLAMARSVLARESAVPQGDDRRIIACATRFHGAGNGTAVLWREPDLAAFPAEDSAILEAVADTFGVAIALLARYEMTVALARTDPLTGLLNRRGFSEEVTRRMARLARAGQPACLLYIDLDNFKLVNDTYGHEAGDRALVALSRTLCESSRPGDVVARLGGDEFVLWLDGIGEEAAPRRAIALSDACRPLAGLTGDPARPLGVSLGLAVYDPAWPEAPEALLARADAAMYRIKQNGKGSFAIAERPKAESEAMS
jgi:diguanylate cyclase (GGDEF)-like protein